MRSSFIWGWSEEQQTFEGLIQHLKNAFQSSKTTSKLISNFYGQAQKKNESKEAFADELQILVLQDNSQETGI